MKNKSKIISAVVTTAFVTLLSTAFLPYGCNNVSAIDYTAMDIDAMQYSYEIYPLLEPMNEYFYIRTDNPHPESFRFIDNNTDYANFGTVQITSIRETNPYADVVYENSDMLRVTGGYIFRGYNTDGGELTLQIPQDITEAEYDEIHSNESLRDTVDYYKKQHDGYISFNILGYFEWVDTDVTFNVSKLYDVPHYLIDTYAIYNDFFDNMSAVQKGFDEICLYSGSYIRGELYDNGTGWSLTPGFHVDQPYYIYSPYDRRDNRYLLMSSLYPFRYDSLGFPAIMADVAGILSNNEASIKSTSGEHAYIDVTYNSITKTYGGAGNGEGQGIDDTDIIKVFDFSTEIPKETIESVYDYLNQYAKLDIVDDIPRDNELTFQKIYDIVGDGAWVDMGGYYAYMWQTRPNATVSSSEWGVGNKLYWGGALGFGSGIWIDGRYVNKSFHKGATFDDFPTADVMLTKVKIPTVLNCTRKFDWDTNNYIYSDVEVSETIANNVLFKYNSDTNTWILSGINEDDYICGLPDIQNLVNQGYLDSSWIDSLTLTEDEVREIIASGNTNHNPINGYVYDDGYENGIKFSVGDANSDGEFNIADLVAVQKFLLGDWTADMSFWRSANLINENESVIDVFDFAELRKLYVDVNINGNTIAESLGEWYPV